MRSAGRGPGRHPRVAVVRCQCRRPGSNAHEQRGTAGTPPRAAALRSGHRCRGRRYPETQKTGARYGIEPIPPRYCGSGSDTHLSCRPLPRCDRTSKPFLRSAFRVLNSSSASRSLSCPSSCNIFRLSEQARHRLIGTQLLWRRDHLDDGCCNPLQYKGFRECTRRVLRPCIAAMNQPVTDAAAAAVITSPDSSMSWSPSVHP